jgi:predicted nucleic acid-binding protein
VSANVVVLDASVGVKWFKDEPGTAEARQLLDDLGSGAVSLVVPTVFPHEVLDVARRLFGVAEAQSVLAGLDGAGLIVAGCDRALLDSTIELCGHLGCTMYDAAAPALAARLGCALVSADRRAHAGVDGVRIIG